MMILQYRKAVDLMRSATQRRAVCPCWSLPFHYGGDMPHPLTRVGCSQKLLALVIVKLPHGEMQIISRLLFEKYKEQHETVFM
jgi:hypothetical protein